MNRLKGAVAIVTGGAVGIGRAACVRLAEEGAAVAITDVRAEEGHALAAEIVSAGGAAAFWRLDVSRESDVREVFAAVTARFGPVTVLVNNAGIAGVNKPTHEITEAEWEALMAVNVKGVFFCTKHAIPALRQAGGGSIINIRVNSIHPGFIWTPLVETFAASQGDVADVRKALDAKHPLGHVGDPDDIAWGIVYLASDEAKFITGSELVIDGGYTAQ